VTALTAVLFSGIVHGLWTDRWAGSEELAAAVARLDDIALDLGDWRGEEVQPNPGQFSTVSGHCYRRYQNRRTGASVTVALVCGRPGPVSIHTPDVCYAAGGFEIEPPSRVTLPAGPDAPAAEFWTAQMQKTRATDRTTLRVFWSWNAAGAWEVPDQPRLAFARHEALYKLYLVRELTTTGEAAEEDPCLDLARQLLPELQRALFSRP
jgi:hypothetical protein